MHVITGRIGLTQPSDTINHTVLAVNMLHKEGGRGSGFEDGGGAGGQRMPLVFALSVERLRRDFSKGAMLQLAHQVEKSQEAAGLQQP